eukprot:TRINITY_DN7034_c0_g3_i2.p2 TRINITY_DN7034_c0_g3~~TRINITY_DN7034_c0_g3_i2.p2  ORF type:complete len:112 (-),score=26.17 TRINITY_DN7034_c0_g3_i2:279-593(-)
MEEDFASLLSRVASNDPALVEFEVNARIPGILKTRAELVQRVVAALATNARVMSLKFRVLGLTEADIAPLAELLQTRNFEQLHLGSNKLTGCSRFAVRAHIERQ